MSYSWLSWALKKLEFGEGLEGKDSICSFKRAGTAGDEELPKFTPSTWG